MFFFHCRVSLFIYVCLFAFAFRTNETFLFIIDGREPATSVCIWRTRATRTYTRTKYIFHYKIPFFNVSFNLCLYLCPFIENSIFRLIYAVNWAIFSHHIIHIVSTVYPCRKRLFSPIAEVKWHIERTINLFYYKDYY